MASVAGSAGEGLVNKLLHEPRRCGLVWVVAGQAVGGGKGLLLVCTEELRVARVMAIQAHGRRRFGEVKIKLTLACIPDVDRPKTGRSRRFVGHMAGVAAHVERRVAAAFLRHILASVMAAQARLSFLPPTVAFRSWFLFSEAWGSWHFEQSRTAGLCTLPLVAAALLTAPRAGGREDLSAWQLRQSAVAVVVTSLMRVMPRFTRTSWQAWQPEAIAEWTATPFDLASWHSRHFAESVFSSSGTGCLPAHALGPRSRIRASVHFREFVGLERCPRPELGEPGRDVTATARGKFKIALGAPRPKYGATRLPLR